MRCARASLREESVFMSVQSNSNSSGSLDGAPSCSQFSTGSPTPGSVSPLDICAPRRLKEGKTGVNVNLEFVRVKSVGIVLDWRVILSKSGLESKRSCRRPLISRLLTLSLCVFVTSIES